MGRRRIVRLQILLLVGVTILVIGRTLWTTKQEAGQSVSFSGLEAHRLSEQGFELDGDAGLRIRAVGSAATRRSDDSTMAAFAWIIDATTREPIWVMHKKDAANQTGTVIEVDTTVDVSAGSYIAYFASFGPSMTSTRRPGFLGRLLRSSDHWINDARRWELNVRVGAGQTPTLKRQDAARLDTSAVVWRTGPLESRRHIEELFEVRRPVSIVVHATGQITEAGERHDYGWIVDAETIDTVWVMTTDNSRWAGGVRDNRASVDTVTLEPGVFAFGFSTDARHAVRDWRGTPPFDPRGWGMRVVPESVDDTSAVARFDPRDGRDPIIDLTRIGNDADVSRRFSVTDSVLTIVEAVGEISRSRYDYGWLESLGGERVWEMTDRRSVHAGGHSSNRREIAFVRLAPGDYRLRYQTDGSHAFDAWRHDPPDVPERWGVALFARDPQGSNRIELIEEELQPEIEIEERPLSDTLQSSAGLAPGLTAGEVLADLSRLGNEREVNQTFEVSTTTDVFVRAIGEITLNSRFDYGWIEHADSGEIVWQMTYDNTVAAGGAGRNRLYEGLVKLPPGTYRVRFQTDFSHAFGDFPSGEGPDDPEGWGIVVRLFEE
jgi:hypothetical protein